MDITDFRIAPIFESRWGEGGLYAEYASRLSEALEGWDETWQRGRKKDVVQGIVLDMTRQIVAQLPGLPEYCRQKCRDAKTVEDAFRACAIPDSRTAEAMIDAGVNAWSAYGKDHVSQAVDPDAALTHAAEAVSRAGVAFAFAASAKHPQADTAAVAARAARTATITRALDLWIEAVEQQSEYWKGLPRDAEITASFVAPSK